MIQLSFVCLIYQALLQQLFLNESEGIYNSVETVYNIRKSLCHVFKAHNPHSYIKGEG